MIGLRLGNAVTFIDNHDTGFTQNLWPFPPDKVIQGYVYILTHPGIPSVVSFFHLFFFFSLDGLIFHEALLDEQKVDPRRWFGILTMAFSAEICLLITISSSFQTLAFSVSLFAYV